MLQGVCPKGTLQASRKDMGLSMHPFSGAVKAR